MNAKVDVKVSLQIEPALFDTAFAQLSYLTSEVSAAAANINMIVGMAMQVAQNIRIPKVPKPTNRQKKRLVIMLISTWVQENDRITEEDRAFYEHTFIPYKLADSIDNLCNLHVNRVKKRAVDRLLIFCCCRLLEDIILRPKNMNALATLVDIVL